MTRLAELTRRIERLEQRQAQIEARRGAAAKALASLHRQPTQIGPMLRRLIEVAVAGDRLIDALAALHEPDTRPEQVNTPPNQEARRMVMPG